MVNEKFVGTWTLVSSEYRRSDGTVVYPQGKDTIGVLMYDKHGHMSVQIMNPHRPRFASGDQQKGTPAEVKAAFEGYISYFGDYEVDEAENAVIHHTRGCLFPNLVGQAQKRFFEFSGNRLILSTPPILAGGSPITGELTWELSV